MRRTALILLTCALLALPAFAGDDALTPAQLAGLAKGVKSYPTKFKLISMGVRAVAPLMGQLESNDKWLVFESKSALRWIVHHARRDKQDVESLAHHLAEYVSPDVGHAEGQRAFAAELLGDLGAAKGVPALMKAASSGEANVRTAALDALSRIPGTAVTSQLAALAWKLSGDRQDAVLQTLGRRRDPAGLPPLRHFALKGNRVAVKALGVSGLAGAGDVLLKLFEQKVPGALDALVAVARRQGGARLLLNAYRVSTTLEERLPLIQALGDVPPGASGAVSVLLDAMNKDLLRVAAQHALLNLAGRPGWQHPEVYRSVLAGSDDEAVTLRALAGLGRTGRTDDVRLLEPFVGARKPAIRTTALTALGRLPGKAATAALIQQLDAAADTDDVRLLIRLLEERGSAEAMPALMKVMTVSKGNVKKEAGEALIALAAKGSVDAARKVHHQLLAAGVQMAALRGLARTGDASSIDKIAPFSGAASGELTSLASAALIAIGDRLAKTDRPNAIKAWRAALEFGAMVENKLRLLGESVEITARGGRVSAWWIVGPFPAADQAAWSRAEFPEKNVELGEATMVGNREYSWQPVQVGGEDAIVDLDSLLSPNDNVVAYAFAEIHVKKARKVVFKGGSDDGLRVWVNGKLVHTVFEPRGITVDGDTFEAELNEGRNEILVKCCEIGGGWGFCLRMETEKGRPLKFKIR